MTAREWDAPSYDRIADPMTRWGGGVVERLRVAPDAVVLDAGCGTGRVTEQLLARVPRGRVVALDGSRAMLEQARARLAAHLDRVELVHADLTAPLPLAEPVDAVVSTATFHWVPGHEALFARLAAVLRPGGQLSAQWGAAGNVASVVQALARVSDGWHPWTYAGPTETKARLERAGFRDASTWTFNELVTFDSDSAFEEYLGTVVLGTHLARLPEREHPAFVRAVAGAMPRRALDYVRLNAVAWRR